MKHIPVDRDAGSAAFRDAVAALKAGELVGVFPEATMSRSFEIKEIKNGAVRMARAADVPLIPMIIFGGAPAAVIRRQGLLARQADLHHRRASRCRFRGAWIPTPSPRSCTRGWRRCSTPRSTATPTSRPGAWWIPARRGGSAPTLEEALAIEERVREEKAARRAAEGKPAQDKPTDPPARRRRCRGRAHCARVRPAHRPVGRRAAVDSVASQREPIRVRRPTGRDAGR